MIMEAQSLYDYLGRPAGPDLGKKVHDAAVAEGAWVGTKNVDPSVVSSGYVRTYLVSFLDKYFKRKSAIQTTLEDKIKILEDKVQLLEDKIDLLLPHFKTNKLEADDLPF